MHAMPNPFDKLIDDFENAETMRNEMQALAAMRVAVTEHGQVPSPEQEVRFLTLLSERDKHDEVWRRGMELDQLFHNKMREEHPIESLEKWFWEPFNNDSAVYRVLAPRIGDEDAMIFLARYLSIRDYPRTDFHRIRRDEGSLNDLFFGRTYNAMFFIGRPRIYGPALRREFEAGGMLYGFPDLDRPKDVPLGSLRPDYHHIREYFGADRQRFQDHTATDSEQGVRRDFGIVQRYMHSIGNARQVVIVNAAGCSPLGTLAAIRFATEMENLAIPVPPELERESKMECLVSAEAKVTEFPYTWAWPHARLERLLIGGFEWASDLKEWKAKGPGEIRMTCNSKGRPLHITNESGVELANQGSQKSAFLAALVLLQLLAEEKTSEGVAWVKLDDVLDHPFVVAQPQFAEGVVLNRTENTLKSAFRYDRDRRLIRLAAVVTVERP